MMRLVVVSDSHGNARALEEVVRRHRQEADAFLHLGDGLQELSRLLDREPGLPFFYVRGNCDSSLILPQAQKTEIRSFGPVKILYTHGDLYQVKWDLDTLWEAAHGAQAQVALYGHSHLARADYLGGIHLINPGSLTQPREGQPGYLVLDITPEGVAVPSHRNLY